MNDILEITSSQLALEALINVKENQNLFQTSEFISFPLLLAFGDINNIEAQDYRLVLDKTINNKEILTKLISTTNNFSNVRIWTSTNCPNGYLNMLFIIYLLQDRNDIEFSIVDTRKAFIYADCPDYSPSNILSVPDELFEKLLKCEEIMSVDKIKTFINEWNVVCKENSPLRICQNGKIISVNDDHIDQSIIEILRQNNIIQPSQLIGYTMAEQLYNVGELGDYFFEYRIKKLIENNSIKLTTGQTDNFYQSTLSLT